MQEKGTGIRKRRRGNLGYRQAGLADPSAANDPELSGRELEKYTAKWAESAFQPWDSENRTPSPPRRWFERHVAPAVFGVMACGLIAFVLWRFRHGDPPPAVAVTPRAEDNRAAFERQLPERVKSATTAARRFLAATDVNAMLPLIRDRERVEAALRAWYREQPPYTLPIREVQLHGAACVERSVFIRLLAETTDRRQVVVTLEETPSGWLVDWESFVAWGEVLWEDLSKGRNPGNQPALVRGYLAFSGNYEPPFSASSHQSFTLRDPSGMHSLPAWMTSDPLKLMHLRGAIFDAGSPEIEVIVRVQPVPGDPPGRLEITDVLQTGWILRSRRQASGVIFQSDRTEK